MPIPTAIWTGIPGTPATPQFAEVVYKSQIAESDGSSQTLINIMHFLRTGGPGTTVEAALMAAIDGAMAGGLWTGLFNADVNNIAKTVRFMDDPNRPAVVLAGFGVGVGVGSRAASFVSTVIRKLGYGRGRYWRGSNHWGPPLESDYSKDDLNGAGIANWTPWQNAMKALINPFAVGPDTWQMCILSTTQCDFSVNPSIFAGSLVSDCVLNVRLGTMKRRKERVGI